MTRVKLKSYGSYGATVNVVAAESRGEPVAVVEWREAGVKKSKQFKGTRRDREAAAKAYGEGMAERLRAGEAPAPTRQTVKNLWDAYITAHAPDWRPKTLAIARARWQVFMTHVAPHTYADLVQMETLDSWRKELLETDTRRGVPMARNQVAHHIQLVKSVWRFARQRRLLRENVLADYAVKKGRDYQPMSVPEFTPAEFSRLMAQLSYRTRNTWRIWALIALDGLLAPRSTALLNLRWDDVVGRTVTWRGELDKVGRTRVQQLPRDAVFVLRVCRVWAAREGRQSPYVFSSRQARTAGKPFTYSSLNAGLHEAARKAGIPRIQYKAMHSIRRMVAGNVLALTGDITKVGLWLGDTDVRVMQRSYLRDRPEDAATMVAELRLPSLHTTGDQTASAPVKARKEKV